MTGDWRDESAHFLGLALARITGEPAPPAEPDDATDADEFLIELDALEAERFRLECERDARADQGNWPHD
jgi:hypothetical protein